MYVARAPFISGAERALLSMLRHLDRSAVEPSVVLGHDTQLTSDIGALDIPVTLVPLPKRSAGKPVAWWRSVRGLARCVRDHKPDVLHANDVPSCQAMSVLGARDRIPRVLHIRWGITAADAAWWARDGVEAVICISRWVKDELGDCRGTSLADAEVCVLPDSVDWPEQGDRRANGPEDPRERLGDTPDRAGSADRWLRLGFAGQIIESKGLDLVIRAIALLPEAQRPNLLVAGEDTQTGGRYKAHLQELAAREGVAERVQWLGFVDDVAELYSRVDAVVCPSRLEPLGLVPLEAARYGIPAIANRVGGLAETVEHDRTGYLVDPTPEAWAHAIGGIKGATKLRKLGVAAWQKTIDKYSPGSYQRVLLGWYRRVMRSPESPAVAHPRQAQGAA